MSCVTPLEEGVALLMRIEYGGWESPSLALSWGSASHVLLTLLTGAVEGAAFGLRESLLTLGA